MGAATAFPSKAQLKRATAAAIEAARDARITIVGVRVLADGSVEVVGQGGMPSASTDFDRYFGKA